MRTIIEKCIERAGGITSLAKSLKITHQAIYSWKKIPSERVVDIERVTGISRQQLRPDLYAGMNASSLEEPAE